VGLGVDFGTAVGFIVGLLVGFAVGGGGSKDSIYYNTMKEMTATIVRVGARKLCMGFSFFQFGALTGD